MRKPAGHNGAGDIAAAAGKRLDLAVRHRAVESRHHKEAGALEALAEQAVGHGIKVAFFGKLDAFRRFHEDRPQELGHQAPVQVLAARSHVIGPIIFSDVAGDLVEMHPDIEFRAEFLRQF